MQCTSPGIDSVGHDKQSGEPFGKIAQHDQVNTQLATKNLPDRTNQKGCTQIHVSRCTYRRYDEPKVNRSYASAVINATESCALKPTPL